jgi:hypothetical protein
MPFTLWTGRHKIAVEPTIIAFVKRRVPRNYHKSLDIRLSQHDTQYDNTQFSLTKKSVDEESIISPVSSGKRLSMTGTVYKRIRTADRNSRRLNSLDGTLFARNEQID